MPNILFKNDHYYFLNPNNNNWWIENKKEDIHFLTDNKPRQFKNLTSDNFGYFDNDGSHWHQYKWYKSDYDMFIEVVPISPEYFFEKGDYLCVIDTDRGGIPFEEGNIFEIIMPRLSKIMSLLTKNEWHYSISKCKNIYRVVPKDKEKYDNLKKEHIELLKEDEEIKIPKKEIPKKSSSKCKLKIKLVINEIDRRIKMCVLEQDESLRAKELLYESCSTKMKIVSMNEVEISSLLIYIRGMYKEKDNEYTNYYYFNTLTQFKDYIRRFCYTISEFGGQVLLENEVSVSLSTEFAFLKAEISENEKKIPKSFLSNSNINIDNPDYNLKIDKPVKLNYTSYKFEDNKYNLKIDKPVKLLKHKWMSNVLIKY